MYTVENRLEEAPFTILETIAQCETIESAKQAYDAHFKTFRLYPAYVPGTHDTCTAWLSQPDTRKSAFMVVTGIFNDGQMVLDIHQSQKAT